MRLFLLTFFLLCAAPFSVHAGTVFFADLPDVPVMPGLQEQAGDQVNFDHAAGRVVETSAYGVGVTLIQAQRFYAQTLPELGWVKAAPGVYTRGKEELRVTSEALSSGGVRVRLALGPVLPN